MLVLIPLFPRLTTNLMTTEIHKLDTREIPAPCSFVRRVASHLLLDLCMSFPANEEP